MSISHAIYSGNLEQVEFLLKQNKDIINITEVGSDSLPLHHAVIRDDLDMIKLLLSFDQILMLQLCILQ